MGSLRLLGASRPSVGLLAARPVATGGVREYFATDDNGGTLYVSNGTSWSIAGPRGVELGSAQRATFYTTASLAAAAFEDVTGVTFTFTPRERPVLIWAGAASWQLSNSAGRPRLVIRNSGNTALVTGGTNPAVTTAVAAPTIQKRLAIGSDLTEGVAVTLKLSLQNASGATASTITLQSEDSGQPPPFLRAIEL